MVSVGFSWEPTPDPSSRAQPCLLLPSHVWSSPVQPHSGTSLSQAVRDGPAIDNADASTLEQMALASDPRVRATCPWSRLTPSPHSHTHTYRHTHTHTDPYTHAHTQHSPARPSPSWFFFISSHKTQWVQNLSQPPASFPLLSSPGTLAKDWVMAGIKPNEVIMEAEQ